MAEKTPSEAEQVGYHKGSLTTLAKERQELLRILTIVEQLMQMHVSELKKLGVDLDKEEQAAKKHNLTSPNVPTWKNPAGKPIEDLVKK